MADKYYYAIKIMIKLKSKPISSRTLETAQLSRYLHSSISRPNNADSSIPSIKEAEQRIKQLEHRHKWRRQRRLKLLEDTYAQNCRLYLSINSQKSDYAYSKEKAHYFSILKGKKRVSSNDRSKTSDFLEVDRKPSANSKLIYDKRLGQGDQYRVEIRNILQQRYENQQISNEVESEKQSVLSYYDRLNARAQQKKLSLKLQTLSRRTQPKKTQQ